MTKAELQPDTRELPPTGIAIQRAHDFCGIFRLMCVLINGQQVGSVRYAGHAVFHLPPGIYSVQVAMDWCRCEPLEVQVRAGETVYLECGLRWRGIAWVFNLLAVFVVPSRVFIVRHEEQAEW